MHSEAKKEGGAIIRASAIIGVNTVCTIIQKHEHLKLNSPNRNTGCLDLFLRRYQSSKRQHRSRQYFR